MEYVDFIANKNHTGINEKRHKTHIEKHHGIYFMCNSATGSYVVHRCISSSEHHNYSLQGGKKSFITIFCLHNAIQSNETREAPV